jgi:ABC-type nickel/cobalt efflux system permease component RcnA
MNWLELSAVALIVGWACVFLYKRWRRPQRADGACGSCSKTDCGSY